MRPILTAFATALLMLGAAACADASSSQTPPTSVPSTTPSTSSVTTTTIPASTAVASTSVDTAATETIGPAEAVDLLAEWPPRPARTPDLADVPMLLPSASMTGTPTRVEHADDPATVVSYYQYWADGSGGTVLSIQTDLLRSPASGGEPVDVAPWNGAFYPTMAPGFASLVLVDPSGTVTLWSNGLDREQLLAIGASLRSRADDAAGWDAAVTVGFTPVHEGWSFGAATRTLQWSDAELTIFSGVPSVIDTPSGWVFDRLTDVGGSLALLYDDGDRAAITWSPEPDVVVVMGAFRSGDELLAIARSMHPADPAAWDAVSTAVPIDDRCGSLFFC